MTPLLVPGLADAVAPPLFLAADGLRFWCEQKSLVLLASRYRNAQGPTRPSGSLTIMDGAQALHHLTVNMRPDVQERYLTEPHMFFVLFTQDKGAPAQALVDLGVFTRTATVLTVHEYSAQPLAVVWQFAPCPHDDTVLAVTCPDCHFRWRRQHDAAALAWRANDAHTRLRAFTGELL